MGYYTEEEKKCDYPNNVWTEIQDPKTGSTLYFNEVTEICRTTKPEGFVAGSRRKRLLPPASSSSSSSYSTSTAAATAAAAAKNSSSSSNPHPLVPVLDLSKAKALLAPDDTSALVSSAFNEAVWRWRLIRDYGGGPPSRAAYALIPAIVNSYGGWHPSFTSWWRGAVRTAAEHAGPSSSQAGMLWRTLGFLSVTLQRSTSQVLAACAPAMRPEVEGRLGRPLSEAP